MTVVGDLSTDTRAIDGPQQPLAHATSRDGLGLRRECRPVIGTDVGEEVSFRTGAGQRHALLRAEVKSKTDLAAIAELLA